MLPASLITEGGPHQTRNLFAYRKAIRETRGCPHNAFTALLPSSHEKHPDSRREAFQHDTASAEPQDHCNENVYRSTVCVPSGGMGNGTEPGFLFNNFSFSLNDTFLNTFRALEDRVQRAVASLTVACSEARSTRNKNHVPAFAGPL